jgi:hypothetical protein
MTVTTIEHLAMYATELIVCSRRSVQHECGCLPYPNEADAGSVFLLLEQGSNYFMYVHGWTRLLIS